jgi:glutathione S-transferase
MSARLFVVHGSHPCVTVERALELKGLPFGLVELPPFAHAGIQRVLFGARTVPAIRFDDGEKVSGSRAILARLEERVPDPPLLPADPAARERVLEAERWGDEVFQPVPRSLLWTAFAAHPRAMHAFQDGQRSPKLPMPAVLAAAKVILPVERRLNDVSDAATRTAIAELPGMLDRIDGLIATGVLNGEQPNAADLQIAPTIRLLYALHDVRPLIEGRPAEAFAFRWFDRPVATVPAGALPVEAATQTATSPAG